MLTGWVIDWTRVQFYSDGDKEACEIYFSM